MNAQIPHLVIFVIPAFSFNQDHVSLVKILQEIAHTILVLLAYNVMELIAQDAKMVLPFILDHAAKLSFRIFMDALNILYAQKIVISVKMDSS